MCCSDATVPTPPNYSGISIPAAQAAATDTTNSQGALAFAKDQYAQAAPAIQQYTSTAANYNTPARASQNAGAAEADVATQFDTARKASLSSLESYGIDPSQTRFGALDLGTRVSQAAATAAAGTGARLQTETTGLGLQASAIGIQGNAATTYGNLQGTGTQWAGAANQSLGTAASAINTGFNNAADAAKIKDQQTQSHEHDIGSLVGAAGAAAVLLA